MAYDMQTHIPGRLEQLFMVLESNGSLEGFDAVVDNLKMIVGDSGFIHDVHDYEQERDGKIANANKECRESQVDACNIVDHDVRVESLNNAEIAFQNRLQAIYGDYIDTVKTYIVGYVQKVNV